MTKAMGLALFALALGQGNAVRLDPVKWTSPGGAKGYVGKEVAFTGKLVNVIAHKQKRRYYYEFRIEWEEERKGEFKDLGKLKRYTNLNVWFKEDRVDLRKQYGTGMRPVFAIQGIVQYVPRTYHIMDAKIVDDKTK